MILARIYPFTRKDIKIKLDRIKEEVACIRTTNNVCIWSFIFISFIIVLGFEISSKAKRA